MRAVIVCGALMVRDEEANIERCLRSMAQFVDSVVILDTWSVDDTLSVAATVLDELDIPYQFRHRQFDDYASSRTFLVEHARKDCDWVLMVDADMTIAGERRPELPAEAQIGLVEFELGGKYSQRAVYLRADVEWRYEGELHEAVTADTPHRSERVSGVTVTHHGEAGAKRGAAQDLAILERLASAQPDQPQWKFYMAQAFKVLGRTDEAIAAYRTAAMAGDPEDEWVWYCMFQAAALSRDPHALAAAGEVRPWRAETWYALVCLLGDLGRHDLALPFARKAASLIEPPDSLFVHRAVYVWAASFELTVCLAANGLFDEALLVAKVLLAAVPTLPDEVREQLTQYHEQWLLIMVAVP